MRVSSSRTSMEAGSAISLVGVGERGVDVLDVYKDRGNSSSFRGSL